MALYLNPEQRAFTSTHSAVGFFGWLAMKIFGGYTALDLYDLLKSYTGSAEENFYVGHHVYFLIANSYVNLSFRDGGLHVYGYKNL